MIDLNHFFPFCFGYARDLPFFERCFRFILQITRNEADEAAGDVEHGERDSLILKMGQSTFKNKP